jgi:hypothetical protein
VLCGRTASPLLTYADTLPAGAPGSSTPPPLARCVAFSHTAPSATHPPLQLLRAENDKWDSSGYESSDRTLTHWSSQEIREDNSVELGIRARKDEGVNENNSNME